MFLLEILLLSLSLRNNLNFNKFAFKFPAKQIQHLKLLCCFKELKSFQENWIPKPSEIAKKGFDPSKKH